MISIIHWISAKRRLTEAQKTVTMLSDDKYSERGVPPMVLAQRDFIEKEVKYYEERALLWGLFFIGVLFFYVLYYVYMNKVINHV